MIPGSASRPNGVLLKSRLDRVSHTASINQYCFRVLKEGCGCWARKETAPGWKSERKTEEAQGKSKEDGSTDYTDYTD